MKSAPAHGLKVIGAGFGRTGTLSLYTALNQLGFPCYHMARIFENKEDRAHLDFWCEVANGEAGTQYDWERVYSKYTAALDNPTCCVWRELLVAYPDAKVILTVHPRGAEAWYESTIDTIYSVETMWQFKVLAQIVPFIRKLDIMARKLIWQRALKGSMNDRAKAVERYHEHIAEVKAAVPAEQLLVYSVDQGWQPLCNFLGVPVPATEFPNVNDRADIKRAIRGLASGAYIVLGIGALVLAAISYGILRVFA